MLIDITTPLAADTAVWPGDTPIAFDFVATIRQGSSVNVGRLICSVHAATHADAPLHFDDGGEPIDGLDLDPYVGPARVLDCRGATSIDVQHLGDPGPARLLFRTDAALDRRVFPTSIPALTPAAIRELAARSVVLVGFDLPSVDAIDSKTLPNHHALAAAKVRILENLRLAHVEPGDYELIALPLKIIGADAAPVRAVLRSQV